MNTRCLSSGVELLGTPSCHTQNRYKCGRRDSNPHDLSTLGSSSQGGYHYATSAFWRFLRRSRSRFAQDVTLVPPLFPEWFGV